VIETNETATLRAANDALRHERTLRRSIERKYSAARRELDIIDRQLRGLSHDNALLRRRIAELESRG
jgi:chromosome segregation ATPase